MATEDFAEIAAATGYQSRVGTGLISSTAGVNCYAGKQNVSGTVTEWRGFMCYDTSSLAGKTLTAASLFINLDSVTETGSPPATFSVLVYVAWDSVGSELDSPGSLSAEWNNGFFTELEDIGGMGVGDTYEIVIPAPITDWINQSGDTEFKMVYVGTMTTDSSWKANYKSNRSKLSVTYEGGTVTLVPVVYTFGG